MALLTTKLYVPPLQPGLVSRPYLLKRLVAGQRCKLTLISAPVGFGKTTLLVEWLYGQTSDSDPNLRASASLPTPLASPFEMRAGGQANPYSSIPGVAWLSLDENDNDPARFWTYVIAALQTIRPGIGEAALAILHAPEPQPDEDVLTMLINDIAAADLTGILVLDDYHLITTPAIHHSLTYWLDHLPPRLHLVIASRADPPLPLARLRARGQLAELRAADLLFSPAEVTTYLNEVMDLRLSAEDVQTLAARTEGWIASLYLAALSLQRRADKHTFVATFAGSDRYIVDYLVTEVLHQQPPHLQAFLRQTAILDRLNGSLCDAVTGGDDGQAILEHLGQANLFIIPLDRQREWYRYHHLFADLLRYHLSQSAGPQDIAQLHSRASNWYERRGLIDEAVHHALAAADLARLADLIEAHALTTIFASNALTVLTWLQVLPEELIRSRPHLGVARAWAWVFEPAPPERIEQELQAIEQGAGAVDSMLSEWLACHLTAIRAFLARLYGQDAHQAVRLSRQILDCLPGDNTLLRSAVTMNLGFAYLRLGQLKPARRAFMAASRLGQTSEGNYLYVTLIAIHRQAYILNKQGCLHQALAICREALTTVVEPAARRGRPVPIAGAIYLCLGNILLEWNDLPGAAAALSKGVDLLKLTGSRRLQVHGCASMARLRQAQGDLAGAYALLEAAKPLWPGARSYATALQARLRLTQAGSNRDRLLPLTSWVRKRQKLLKGGVRPASIYLERDWRYTERVSLVRVLIALHRIQLADPTLPDLADVLRFLARQLSAAQASGLTERVIELSILQALALHGQGFPDRALNSLAQALTLAEPENYTRLFVEEGLVMADLLCAAASHGLSLDYVGRLLACQAEVTSVPSSLPGQLPLEPFSDRELEVLRLLIVGLSNKEIARELVLTEGTVKKHTHNIFGKLNVRNRTQAVLQARAAGLI